MAGIIGIRAEDMDQVDALKRAKLDWPKGLPLIRPSVRAPVLVRREGALDFVPARFGFTSKFSSFNARADRLTESPFWGKMFGTAHAVAPVSYVVEWVSDSTGKRPYLVGRKDGGLWFAPALIGKSWDAPGESSFAIVTRPPNAFFAKFHDRMIGALDAMGMERWLSPQGASRDALRDLVGAPGDADLAATPADPGLTKRQEGDWSPLAVVGRPVTWAEVATWTNPGKPRAARGKRRTSNNR